MKYNSKVVALGDMVEELVADANSIVFFNEDIIDEILREISVLHTISTVEQEIQKGDTLVIGDNKFEITAVGEVAQKTFKEIGHCTIKFDGLDEVELPGEIQVKGEIPKINVGDVLQII